MVYCYQLKWYKIHPIWKIKIGSLFYTERQSNDILKVFITLNTDKVYLTLEDVNTGNTHTSYEILPLLNQGYDY